MTDSREEVDPVPEGVCTALSCKCDVFKPNHQEGKPMYCARKACRHSVEWHHVAAKDLVVK